ncbi:hypothetical protein U716_07980 [Rhodobacter capsulatus B6]|nr:hypothetical protein U716_07980 [Rhodobacter capsulatus B6]
MSLRGIDISNVAIDIARDLSIKKGVQNRVSYEVKSLLDIPTSEKASIISIIHVLEHCPDMSEMLRECAARAKFVYINVPLEFNLFYALRRGVPKNQYKKYGHIHFFDEDFFLSWLRANSYEVVANVYSRDYMIKKSGLGYKAFQLLRRLSHAVLGPKITIRYLAGISGGYLVRPINNIL